MYTWGFGYTATKFLKNSENFLERNIMRVGFGLGIFPIVSIILGVLRVPMDWKIFLFLSFIVPTISLFVYLIKGKSPELKLRLTKSNINIFIVLVLAGLSFFMYAGGAFKYPWLEDDDPWAHAHGIKFIKIEKTIFEPIKGEGHLHYIDPYPPAYDILMAILHQTSPSMNWTLKFFNSLIICLGIIFFYFFVKKFIGDKNKALFSTFILAAIPCYLSHFIWAHSLVVTLFYPIFYCFEMLKEDKRYMYIAALIIGSILVVQPTQSIKFAVLLLIYWLVKAVFEKKLLLNIIIAGLIGFLLSLSWWGVMLAKYDGLSGLADAMHYQKQGIHVKGTADRLYTFQDFFIARKQNMINNPVGVGVVISLLLIMGLIYLGFQYNSLLKKENSWKLIVLAWLIFTFIGIHGARLPISLFAFRFWMLFAIPTSIIAAEGMWFLFGIGKSSGIPKIFILIVVIIGIFFTSVVQKYTVNTAIWSPGGGFESYEQVMDYSWIRTLPPNTKIFGFCHIDSVFRIIGFDQTDYGWRSDVLEMRQTAINKSVDSIYSWLKKEKYEYTIFDTDCAREYGINATNAKLQELISSGKFQPVKQGVGLVVLKVL